MVTAEIGDDRRLCAKRAFAGVLTGGLRERVRQAKNILIKPDAAHPQLTLPTTQAETLRGVIDALRALTGAPIVIADASEYGARQVFAQQGYEELQKWYTDVTLEDWEYGAVKEVDVPLSGRLWRVRRPAIVADITVSVGVMKTHALYGPKLSVANWAEGTWLPARRRTPEGERMQRIPWFEAAAPQERHQMLSALFSALPCTFSVIDGTLGMEGDGPIHGTVVPMGVMLAGDDPILTDSVGVALMGRDAAAVLYLLELAHAGLGSLNLRDANLPTSLFVERAKEFIFLE